MTLDEIMSAASLLYTPAEKRNYIHAAIGYGAEYAELSAEEKRFLTIECYKDMGITGENEVYDNNGNLISEGEREL